MISAVDIVESTAADMDALAAHYREIFPDEDLMPVVREMLTDKAACLSLIARREHVLAGHVLFTLCGVEGCAEQVALLAPLSVSPSCQRQGVGRALTVEGFRRLKDKGIGQVHVLGDPGYHGRIGFSAEPDVMPPYPIPEEWRAAWQSIRIGEEGRPPKGRLIVPAPWQRPELWAD